MPTENRSSNTEMVSVPRELLERIDRMYTDGMSIFGECEELRALLAQPAQHQGEPFAWFDPKNSHFITADGRATALSMGHGDRLERYSVPLYTHPAPAEKGDPVGSFDKHMEYMQRCGDLEKEIERLRTELKDARAYIEFVDAESEFRKVKLAERDALLREARASLELWHPKTAANEIAKIDAALSASAEPVDPNKPCNHDYRLGECTKCGCISATE